MITLEVGKYYKSNTGNIYGPMVSDLNKEHWYESNDRSKGDRSWLQDGTCFHNTAQFDLIEEVSIYPAQPYKCGEMIEASGDGVLWVKRKFLILNSAGLAVTENEYGISFSWRHHRPIQPVLSRGEVINALKTYDPNPEILRAIELLEESK
jgi:hypothetical protein